MDLFNHQIENASLKTATTSNLICRNDNLINNEISKKAQFYATYRRSQNWSLPESMMHYISKNPKNSEVYQKMVKSCKYFFIKNPILVVSRLNYSDNKKWKLFFGKETLEMSNNISSKLWITKIIFCQTSVKQNLLSSIIPKIFRCSAYFLKLENQIISFNDFCFISLSAKRISFRDITVKNEDGSIVAFEKLFEVVSNIKDFLHVPEKFHSNITFKTFKELSKMPHFLKVAYFSLENIPESFDLEAFYGYMKKNKLTLFNLKFDDAISDAYKNRLETIIVEILASKNHDYISPYIQYPGIDEDKFSKLSLFYTLNSL